MGYREKVQAMCERLGITNPIQEEDLEISAIAFKVQGNIVQISATEMNRAGRLFFQFLLGGINKWPGREEEIKPHMLSAGREYFAENWDDAEEKARPMLIAFKQASHLRIIWKVM